MEYKYTGTISGYSFNPGGCGSVDLRLYDITDDKKPPVRLEAFGPLAKYIHAIEGTDAEERYIKADWYYDRNLYLTGIVIPSSGSPIPAKIITQTEPGANMELKIFGPEEYIEEPNPAPMTMEQLLAWNEFHTNQSTTT